MTQGSTPVCTYSFTMDELKELIVLLRSQEDTLSVTISLMKRYLEKELYANMTIDEAEKFFNEKDR